MSKTIETVAGILSAKFSVPEGEVKENAELGELLTDSLDLVEFSVVVSDQFGVFISGEEMAAVVTVGDVVELVDGKTGPA
ncbi:acyl carrier protein [Actinorugispora endophytica]|uniref:Acyl carrier protein n=1 Tax=Actinorugispora endophytica TaxID=1605990 RepID=A0A4R6UVK6_9ACTN|nr:phosphopantetheine-binding protein [Actinorugispora endophytica]TDQ49989.1 acyl carrier protein [Actinorugispora endophytica]